MNFIWRLITMKVKAAITRATDKIEIEDLEKEYELGVIEALEAEMDKEVDRMMKKAYSRRLNNMYEDMWSTGSFGLR